MKDSGVEWIGDIPDSWILNKMKRYFVFNKGINAGLYTKESIHESGLYPVYSGQTENNGILGYLDYYEYDIDEVLFTTTVGAKVMTLNLLSGKFSLSQNCVLIKPKKRLNLKYYYYYLSSLFEYEKSLIPSYMQPSLRVLDLQKYTILVPSFLEQQRISKYLDKNIQLITEIINDTKQSIEELKKYKQSLITEVVTKGLDKNVEMKDSGIEWIGEIPKGWEVKKIRYLIKETSVKNNKNQKVLSLYRDYGIVYKDSRSDNHNVTSEDTSSYKKVEKGNLVINKMKAWQGSMAISNIEGIISPAYFIFEIIDKTVYLPFLNIALRNNSYLEEYKRLSAGLRIGQWDLNKHQFKNIRYAFPPTIEEQIKIVKYLEHKINYIDNLINKKSKIIIEYESYKKSLIYEYVTGKKEIGQEVE